MEIKQRITEFSTRHHKLITIVMVVCTLGLGSLISLIKVDTDPENMLSANEYVRIFHNETKERFSLSDIVVLGIVNNVDSNGVYNPSSLEKIYELAEFAKTLRWENESNPNEQVGVIEVDLLAPSTVDHIGQGGPGTVTFEWLMNKPPETRAEALEIKNKAMSNPLLKGTLFAESGKAICLYLPLTSKDFSHQIYKQLNKRIPLINLWRTIEIAKIRESVDDTNISGGDYQKLLSGYMALRRLITFQVEDVKEFQSDYVLFSRLLQIGNFSEGSQAVSRALTSQTWLETAKKLDQEANTKLDPLGIELEQKLKSFDSECNNLLNNLAVIKQKPNVSESQQHKIDTVSENINKIRTKIAEGKANEALDDLLLRVIAEIKDELTNKQQIKIAELNNFKESTLQVIETQRRIWSIKVKLSEKANRALENWLSQAPGKSGIIQEDTKDSDAGWLRLALIHLHSLRSRVLSATGLTENVQSFCNQLGESLINSKFLELYPEMDELNIQKISANPPDYEQYHITGLPVAEDTFGVEMFFQMAISAPLAMVVIFILMLLFFRKLVLVISPMIVAMVSVISTMGLLIGFGYPVHIMSSMIPIFLMPIAVVDSVHILSEFFDLYTKEKGRKKTTMEVMNDLFMPMLYTSLTSAAGFASLALTPIPPVQVFGIFVAIGIMIAWLCTITFVPAYIMMIKESSLENFGSANVKVKKQSPLEKILKSVGRFTYTQAKPILLIIMLVTAVAVYGITRIEINDNPVKWFSKSHPIREADIELNKHFGGTYMAYLVMEPNEPDSISPKYISDLRKRLSERSLELRDEFLKITNIIPELEKALLEQASNVETKGQLLEQISTFINDTLDEADANDADTWYELSDFFDMEKERIKVFKQPETLRYISDLQDYLVQFGLVGKSSSVSDIVKKVHQELIDGNPENYKIPDTSPAVAQCMMQFQSSHNPDDLWHMVTTDYMYANIWLQLSSGDNKDMEKVVRAVDLFMSPKPADITSEYEKNKDLEKYVEITAKSQNGKTAVKKIKLSRNEFKDYQRILTKAMSMTKDTAAAWNFKYADQDYAQSLVHKIVEFSVNPPEALKYDWAGLTYINTVWQDKMVWGMLQSFLGSFIIVFIMMSILFRSPLWGIVCMVPLLITIIIIYGIIGLVGKDYDMPVAVLSALTLGMAVDFAIHFLERARAGYAQTCSWEKSAADMFGEPARAITRNVLVIAIGFLPLLAAPLIPYKTVGIFLCAIMALSGAVTLLALPAIIKIAEKHLFKPLKEPKSATCNCAFCITISIASVILIALNVHQYGKMGMSKLVFLSVIITTAMALACGTISRRRACKMAKVRDESKNN
ncbi:MAG: MMPL family transporter [Sedimentisphaerales bacterium]|nr:MMPL family transporter [Sedimentisphaerales bacterium]